MARAPSLKRAFSVTKIAEPPLAAGWVEVSSSKGTPYWRNSSSGATSWSRPNAGAMAPAAAAAKAGAAEAAQPPLPAGWHEKWSNSQQRPYWYHEDSRETAWERPV
jgi:hypothetical protein